MSTVPPSERRRDARIGLSIPVRVKGNDPDGAPWEEMTTTADASYYGTSFLLRHAASVGQVLQLSLPLPQKYRQYALAEASYQTYALIRNTRPGPDQSRIAGVMFLKGPPKGWAEAPGGQFRLPTDPRPQSTSRGERRRYERVPLAVNLRVRRSDPAAGVQEEQTVTENVGRGGARVPTTLPVAKGEKVIVSDLSRSVSAEAVIRNVYIGTDHVPRLNLCFPDPAGLERLLSAAGAPNPPGKSAR
jgi:hypothetical protein